MVWYGMVWYVCMCTYIYIYIHIDAMQTCRKGAAIFIPVPLPGKALQTSSCTILLFECVLQADLGMGMGMGMNGTAQLRDQEGHLLFFYKLPAVLFCYTNLLYKLSLAWECV